VESSCAKIENNLISENIKSNICLGGSNSVNTLIISNKIEQSAGEGILIINSDNCWIIRN
jgi:F-box protein 11